MEYPFLLDYAFGINIRQKWLLIDGDQSTTSNFQNHSSPDVENRKLHRLHFQMFLTRIPFFFFLRKMSWLNHICKTWNEPRIKSVDHDLFLLYLYE